LISLIYLSCNAVMFIITTHEHGDEVQVWLWCYRVWLHFLALSAVCMA
jgi:hypothetical protein